MPKLKGAILSDFTVHHFASLLDNHPEEPAVSARCGPFGQVIPLLLDSQNPFWQKEYDFVLVWTQPERVIHSFNQFFLKGKGSVRKILAEVSEYASLLKNLNKKMHPIFVPLWSLPSYDRGLGIISYKDPASPAKILLLMNQKLIQEFEKEAGIYLLDSARWFAQSGEAAFNPKFWYLAKIPYGDEVFKLAASDIKAGLRAIGGHSKKLVILDLDDTLWGGIVGDLGWENVKLGGHDPFGEAFSDFQAALKNLKNRGVILGIVSKNEEKIALEAIKKNSQMVLNLNDFAAWRINWQDKAKNIVELVSELNLGLQSVVFIDDNPAERDRVRQALPEVTVPDWPENKLLYKKTLVGLSLFDVPAISEEDRHRTKTYVSERKRRHLKVKLMSLGQWLADLKIEVKIAPLSTDNLARATQLLNKTNQMNLSTRRLAETDFRRWSQQKNHFVRVLSVTDRFGNSGLTGIVSWVKVGDTARIVDFVLSCRVMGRKIEETMLGCVFHFCQKNKIKKIEASYSSTPKNKPCLDFFKNSGMSLDSAKQTFSWDMQKSYPFPSVIKVNL